MDKGMEIPTSAPTPVTTTVRSNNMGGTHGDIFEIPKAVQDREEVTRVAITLQSHNPVIDRKEDADKLLEKTREKGITGGLEWLAYGGDEEQKQTKKESTVGQQKEETPGQQREPTKEQPSEKTSLRQEGRREHRQSEIPQEEHDPYAEQLERQVEELEQKVESITDDIRFVKEQALQMQKMNRDLAQTLLYLLRKEIEREENEKKRRSLLELLMKVVNILTEEMLVPYTQQKGEQQQQTQPTQLQELLQQKKAA